MRIGFGYKCGWLAVRAGDAADVLEEVGIHDGVSVAWDEGIQAACRGEKTFAVPVRGWVLVVSTHPMDEKVPALEERLERLSRQFGEVQALVSDRVTDHYLWLRAVDGTIVRSFAQAAGRVVRDVGVGLPFEAARAATAEPGGPRFLTARPRKPRDEGDVLQAAAAWSVDPVSIRDEEQVAGLVGAVHWARPPEPMPIGPVASRKEAELHACWLAEQGCPKCGGELTSARVPHRGDERTYVVGLRCEACAALLALVYTAGPGWDEQPGEDDPRLTSVAAPSGLIPPGYLLQRAERMSKQAHDRAAGDFAARMVAAPLARFALEALDELEKHRDFVIPNRALFDKLKTFLRALPA